MTESGETVPFTATLERKGKQSIKEYLNLNFIWFYSWYAPQTAAWWEAGDGGRGAEYIHIFQNFKETVPQDRITIFDLYWYGFWWEAPLRMYGELYSSVLRFPGSTCARNGCCPHYTWGRINNWYINSYIHTGKGGGMGCRFEPEWRLEEQQFTKLDRKYQHDCLHLHYELW